MKDACGNFRPQLSLYIEEELDAAGRQALDGHLAQCRSCSAELESLRAMLAGLKTLPAAPVPQGFRQAVWRRIDRAPGWQRLLQQLRERWAVGVPVGAIATTAVVLLAVQVMRVPPRQTKMAEPVHDSLDKAQIAKRALPAPADEAFVPPMRVEADERAIAPLAAGAAAPGVEEAGGGAAAARRDLARAPLAENERMRQQATQVKAEDRAANSPVGIVLVSITMHHLPGFQERDPISRALKDTDRILSEFSPEQPSGQDRLWSGALVKADQLEALLGRLQQRFGTLEVSEEITEEQRRLPLRRVIFEIRTIS